MSVTFASLYLHRERENQQTFCIHSGQRGRSSPVQDGTDSQLRFEWEMLDNIIMGECGHWLDSMVCGGRPMWTLIVFTIRYSILHCCLHYAPLHSAIHTNIVIFCQISGSAGNYHYFCFILKIINGNKNWGKTIVETFSSFVWKPCKKSIINCEDMREYHNK